MPSLTMNYIGDFTLSFDEKILVRDNSPATPAIANIAAPNSGIRITADGQTRFIAGGVQRGKFTDDKFDTDVPINCTDGDATRPGYCFDSDSDCGMYLVSADTIGLSAGGVGRLVISPTGSTFDGPVFLPSYTVATLPAATTAGGVIYVSDETGGAVLAFSDGTNWLRVTDRAIVS